MLARLGARISAFFRATAPDPFVLAILLTALTFLLAAIWGNYSGASAVDRLRLVVDGWQGGFWGLLEFSMQMCLILVTGHALASSPPVARLLGRIAGAARTPRQAVALVSVCAIGFGLVNWGLGLIVGAILARDAGDRLAERSVRPPRALLAAAGYTSLLTWHGGLSGSAPLAAAQPEQLGALIGADLAASIGPLPMSATTGSALNLVATGGVAIIAPLILTMLVPKEAPPDDGAARLPARLSVADALPPRTLPERLERSPVVGAIIGVPALLWLGARFFDDGLDALTLNTANLAFLTLGLLLHGSPIRYAQAIEEGARGCAGIILQFPLYAGIMGVMSDSGLARAVSAAFARAAGDSEGALAAMTFLSAGLVNLFVPSGGGQWAIQGPIAMQAAIDAGARPERLVMAIAYGDQLTNMLQPFWALPLLAITGAKAREVVGYTAIVMVGAGLWLGACLVLV